MNIPTYDELLNPVLKLAKLKPITRRSAALEISELLRLTEEQKSAVIPSGNGTYFGGRVSWAMTFLTKAGLISKIEKATYKITPEGEAFLAKFPDKITVKNLETIEGWQEAWNSSKRYKQLSQEDSAVSSTSPDELIGTAMAVLNDALKVDLLELLKTVDPYFFEQIVIDVLVAMGYGGSRAEAARVTQKSNDGGIDGIINEDRLGLDVIYIQAKRYQNNVGRIDVQNFVGALAGHQANKGIFITTSDYHNNAIEYAKSVSQKLILINGERLAELMIEFNVGVSTEKRIEIKRLDSDYFDS